MNSMFGKSFEPLSQSERIKNKRNKEIFKSIQSSKDICLDSNGNIKSAKNYESYLNTVNGFYECKKSDPEINKEFFNTYLENDLDAFSVSTFQDIKSNTVNFQIYDESGTTEARGRKNIKAKTDGTNTFHTVAEFVTDDLINPELLSQISNEFLIKNGNHIDFNNPNEKKIALNALHVAYRLGKQIL